VKDLATAPLTAGDAGAVAQVWRACEIHDDGEALFTEEDFVSACLRPSMDVQRDTVGVRDGDAIVAVGLLLGERDAFVHVLPSHRGRGIGCRLLRWTEDAGRAAGRSRTCQRLSENEHAAMALLESEGYERGWEDWIFGIELEREPGPPLLPPGDAIRAFIPGRDDRDVFRVIEDAFAEWPDAEESKFEDWSAQALGRPGFVPEHIGVVVHGAQAVGAALLIAEDDGVWVAQLAVARAARGRGLARALLVRAFGIAWRSGRRHVSLATDARTGARGLYEHVGMRVTRTAWEYAKLL
jgi:ribosomal protein S18 acetylase RimI-like enzyme